MLETRPEGPGPERRGAAATTLAFWVALAAFVVAASVLGSVNNSPGSADSCGNLVAARNLVLGRGFVSTAVGNLWVPVPIPSPETTRPPGLPWLLAGAFALAGVSLAIPVLVNAAAVALNALFLRRAVARTCDPRAGNLAGILILFSYDYEMVSIWNNNLLGACTSALLMVGAGRGGGPHRHPWLPVSLAAWSAVGFLMKPTFLLNAVPFSLLVLGADLGKARSRRSVEVVVYLALFVALTSVYWGPNLLRSGSLIDAPMVTSSRLAGRYGVLEPDTYRTVRFGRPMTYGEVARRLGTANMLIVDAKMMAKTVFYSICMNPAVAACATLLILFWRPARWRDYAEVALLMAGVVFEVGVYNHHEFRYLWPMYPCLVMLSCLTVRDFGDWGASRMSDDLAGRFRTLFAFLGACALLIGAFGGLESWRQGFRTAGQPSPAWVSALKRLPPDAVVLTTDVPSVAWWTDRPAVICPVGSREDLSTVVTLYRANHYLALIDDEQPGRGVAFLGSDLSLLDQGPGWKLYRIKGPI
jgi:Dolichyl-phosphate-mannose-protein mannosyltransferase